MHCQCEFGPLLFKIRPNLDWCRPLLGLKYLCTLPTGTAAEARTLALRRRRSLCTLRDFWCLFQEPTSKKHAPTQCFVSFSHNSVYRFEHAFWIRKAHQKPVQNDVRTLQKSMLKICRFSTAIFSGFGLDFGVSWASNLEPSWLEKSILIMLTALGKPS